MSFDADVDQTAAFDEVNRVAFQALATLAPHGSVDPLSRRPLESYISLMFDAVLGDNTAALSNVVRDMRRARVTSASIAEIYVPCVARRLGDAWVADTLNFGAVTIGSARLQGLLWRLEKDWAVPNKPVPRRPPAFLVGVPAGNQHTLGATILAGQLRHRGMSVNLDLELTPSRLLGHVINQQLSGILLSAAASDPLASLKDLVDICRKSSRNTPVIIGGSILEPEDDIQSQLGADLVTTSVHDVLWFCNALPVAQDDTFSSIQEGK